MAQAQFAANFRCPWLISKENDFESRAQRGPTGDRIPLDGADVPAEGLRRGKQSQHGCVPYLRISKTSNRLSVKLDPLELPRPQRQIDNAAARIQVVQQPPTINHNARRTLAGPPVGRDSMKGGPSSGHDHHIGLLDALLRRGYDSHLCAQCCRGVKISDRIKGHYRDSVVRELLRQKQTDGLLDHIRIRLIGEAQNARTSTTGQITAHGIRQPLDLKVIEFVSDFSALRARTNTSRKVYQREI